MNHNIIVAKNMKTIRELHNKSLRQIEMSTGIGNSRLSKMENNNLQIHINSLEVLANYYNINMIFFFIEIESGKEKEWLQAAKDSKELYLTVSLIQQLLK